MMRGTGAEGHGATPEQTHARARRATTRRQHRRPQTMGRYVSYYSTSRFAIHVKASTAPYCTLLDRNLIQADWEPGELT